MAVRPPRGEGRLHNYNILGGQFGGEVELFGGGGGGTSLAPHSLDETLPLALLFCQESPEYRVIQRSLETAKDYDYRRLSSRSYCYQGPPGCSPERLAISCTHLSFRVETFYRELHLK